MKYPVYLYIAVMAIVTYLIRMLPLTLIKKEIKILLSALFILCALCYPVCNDLPGHYLRNCFSCFRSCRFGSGTVFAYKGKSLFQVSIAACAIVFILEFFV